MLIKWLKAENFLSIGPTGIHIQFDQLGNIVVVKGKNLDISPESSNGAGKSTIIAESLSYGFYGKLIKGLTHKEVINKKNKKGLKLEICFDLDGDEYLIKRTRKPDSLELFKNKENITLGGMPTTQVEIENIIKLNYAAFINIVCFGEHNNHSFLSCDLATKRSIVENLLGLEKYLKYSKTAKECLKEIEGKLSIFRKNYESLNERLDSSSQRINQLTQKQQAWINLKKKEIDQLERDLQVKSVELTKTEDGNASLLFEQAQNRINQSKDEIVKCEAQRSQLITILDQIKDKQEKLQESRNSQHSLIKDKESEINRKKTEIKTIEQQIGYLDKLQPGVKCNACFGTVDPSNYNHLITYNRNIIDSLRSDIENLLLDHKNLNEKFQEVVKSLTSINDLKKTTEEKQSQVSYKINGFLSSIQKDSLIKQPQVGAREVLLKEQYAEINRRLESKRKELEEQDPYLEMIGQTQKECQEIETKINSVKSEITNNEELIPYYNFWIEGFGDNGIRSFIIDGILPALNSRINYWLQFLIDNKIALNFDNKFEATIERNPADGDPFVYEATSGGERRRINLAISQAFAHITLISSGCSLPSVNILDEIGLNIDTQGMLGIYNMIVELAKDRQVFVITHDQHLNDLLANADCLTVVKKDGFSNLSYVKNN